MAPHSSRVMVMGLLLMVMRAHAHEYIMEGTRDILSAGACGFISEKLLSHDCATSADDWGVCESANNWGIAMFGLYREFSKKQQQSIDAQMMGGGGLFGYPIVEVDEDAAYADFPDRSYCRAACDANPSCLGFSWSDELKACLIHGRNIMGPKKPCNTCGMCDFTNAKCQCGFGKPCWDVDETCSSFPSHGKGFRNKLANTAHCVNKNDRGDSIGQQYDKQYNLRNDSLVNYFCREHSKTYCDEVEGTWIPEDMPVPSDPFIPFRLRFRMSEWLKNGYFNNLGKESAALYRHHKEKWGNPFNWTHNGGLKVFKCSPRIHVLPTCTPSTYHTAWQKPPGQRNAAKDLYLKIDDDAYCQTANARLPCQTGAAEKCGYQLQGKPLISGRTEDICAPVDDWPCKFVSSKAQWEGPAPKVPHPSTKTSFEVGPCYNEPQIGMCRGTGSTGEKIKVQGMVGMTINGTQKECEEICNRLSKYAKEGINLDTVGCVGYQHSTDFCFVYGDFELGGSGGIKQYHRVASPSEGVTGYMAGFYIQAKGHMAGTLKDTWPSLKMDDTSPEPTVGIIHGGAHAVYMAKYYTNEFQSGASGSKSWSKCYPGAGFRGSCQMTTEITGVEEVVHGPDHVCVTRKSDECFGAASSPSGSPSGSSPSGSSPSPSGSSDSSPVADLTVSMFSMPLTIIVVVFIGMFQ